jgi:ABC-2 type transport system permease protein
MTCAASPRSSGASSASPASTQHLFMLFGFAFIWVFIALGLVAGTPQAAQGLGLLVFPLSFVSSAYVPIDTMPGWLQLFAEHQPVTVMVDAVRTVVHGPAAEALAGNTAGHSVTRSAIWAVVLTIVFASLAAARYRRS